MKKTIAIAFASLAAAASATVATVSNVAMTQSSEKNRAVTITYDIDADAVVTVDIQTNATGGVWASIGAEHVVSVWGDVNREIEAGTGKEIKWAAGVDWEQHSVAGARAVVTAWALDATPDYMAVSLETPSNVWYYASAGNVPGGVTNDMYKTSWLLMRKIPAKDVTWRMGIAPTDKTTYSSNGSVSLCPAHLVQLTKDYYIGVYQVTQRQFVLMQAQHSGLQYPQRSGQPRYSPASAGESNVGEKKPKPYCDFGWIRGSADSWPGSRDVSNNSDIAVLRRFTGVQFDLPTEAQWEFACRGGEGGGGCLYSGKAWNEANLGEIAWFTGNSSGNHFHDVGEKAPNGFGLYDMIGNAYDVCLDWYQKDNEWYEGSTKDTYTEATVDPSGPDSTQKKSTNSESKTYRSPRVIRGGYAGGSLAYNASHVRYWCENTDSYYVWYYGYRVVAPVGGTW